jgi:F0F1-type ATP synthase gamma subunit
MEEKHKLAQEISVTQSLQLLATAYEEISVMKMRLARDSVLHTRDFLSSLSDVFVNVKTSYTKKFMQENKNKPATLQFSTHQTNGKDIFVLLSAANKLYGDIVYKTFELLKEKVQQSENADIIIIGRTGKELFETTFPGKTYTFYDLPDIVPNIAVLKPIIEQMLQYEHVTVFYGRFFNVVKQEAVAVSISGDEPIEKKAEEQTPNVQKYGFLFEPSIEELFYVFESQIFSSLFKQTLAEEELARLASRITTMEQAISFINTRIGRLTTAEKRAKRQIDNRKQLERLAGIRLWKK